MIVQKETLKHFATKIKEKNDEKINQSKGVLKVGATKETAKETKLYFKVKSSS